MNRKKIDYVPS